MKTIAASTKCPCGATLKAKIPKPSRPTASRTTVACAGCGSRFLLKLDAKQDVTGERIFEPCFEIMELTEKACEALRSHTIKKMMLDENANVGVAIGPPLSDPEPAE